jgi:hypothetical protein
VVGVIVQLYLIRSNAKEASARQVYMSYSDATLKYPELSQPNLEKIKSDPVEYVRYKTFVGQMLFAYDEILSVYDTAEWRKSFNDEFRYHHRFICEDTSPALDELYFPKMRSCCAKPGSAVRTGERNSCAFARLKRRWLALGSFAVIR